MNAAHLLVAVPALAGLRTRHRHGVLPGRAWLAAIAPRLADRAAGDGRAAAPAGRWRTESVTRTGTAVAVAVVRCDSTGDRRVVKVPGTAEGARALHRQAEVLAALHADPRLAGVRPLLPAVLATGEVDGRPYWVESALPGGPVTARTLRRPATRSVLGHAVALVEDLHARTAARVDLDPVAVLDGPLRRLAPYCARQGSAGRLRDLRGELTAALAGRRARVCWIHGDCWPGNLLATGPVVTGLVDWDRAEERQLPLHDLLHLHVLARRMRTGLELGDVVVDALRRGVAPATGVPAGRVAGWSDGLPDRAAVLLYWLRHVSLFIDSEGHRDNRRWLRGNVDRVLAAA